MPARVAVEAGLADSWRGLVGDRGRIVALSAFGESAPAADVYRHFGLTAEAVVEAAETLI